MSDQEVEVGPPTDVFELPEDIQSAQAAPLDLKLKIMIGSNFSVELVKGRLREGAPEVVALLASKYVDFRSHPRIIILRYTFSHFPRLLYDRGPRRRIGGPKKAKTRRLRRFFRARSWHWPSRLRSRSLRFTTHLSALHLSRSLSVVIAPPPVCLCVSEGTTDADEYFPFLYLTTIFS